MTKVKDVLDQFQIPKEQRYPDEMEEIDIGEYTFTDMTEKDDGFIIEFTNKDDPMHVLRINDDRMAVVFLEVVDDENVRVTSWRMGEKFTKTFPRKMMDI